MISKNFTIFQHPKIVGLTELLMKYNFQRMNTGKFCSTKFCQISLRKCFRYKFFSPFPCSLNISPRINISARFNYLSFFIHSRFCLVRKILKLYFYLAILKIQRIKPFCIVVTFPQIILL